MSTATEAEPIGELSGGRWRRLGLSCFLGFTVLAILVSVMPTSVLRDDLWTVTRPYANATGLDQRWDMFGPNPQTISTYVTARVEHADGSTTEYRVPHGRGVSAYWDYRWLKYADLFSLVEANSNERAAYARWVAVQDRRSGTVPVRVALVRHTAPSLPPGSDSAHGPWTETTIYAATLGSR